jgi:hypothetical protein
MMWMRDIFQSDCVCLKSVVKLAEGKDDISQLRKVPGVLSTEK